MLNPVNWVSSMVDLLQPEQVVWLTGGEDERLHVLAELEKQGVAIPLNPLLRPKSYLFRSDPRDVARVEEKTFICSEKEEDAGPTNRWIDPLKMRIHLQQIFKGAMRGRTLYVIPFSMGPIGSVFSKIGIQLTDSLYVVAHMHLMTRVEGRLLEFLKDTPFIPCIHSLGVPQEHPDFYSKWPCNPKELVIAHFPETSEIWSFGSGYGGNALLGKKCLALRIASNLARDGMWLAEHMLIMGVTNPEGKKKYFLGAFPSSCGKTNLALLTPDLPGWKVEVVGDDIAWIRVNQEGVFHAINPEAGFFGIAPGLSWKDHRVIMETISQETLFTNVGLTHEGDVCWQGMEMRPDTHTTTWLGTSGDPNHPEGLAHPNSRFTVSVNRCPSLDPNGKNVEGVPISAILFGGRRSDTVPLVAQSISWSHGVLQGASLSSETTSAATGVTGKLRHDPFAMSPFCGYNMGDYFNHWVRMGKGNGLPKIFQVNWFRKDREGRYLWPGFQANGRVLKWIFERLEGMHQGRSTPIGTIPLEEELDRTQLDISQNWSDSLLYRQEEWKEEVGRLKTYFESFGESFPKRLWDEFDRLKERIWQE